MAKKIVDEQGNTYVQKKPFYKKWWFILLVFIFIVVGASSSLSSKKNVEVKNSTQTESKANYEVTDVKIEKDDFSTYVTGVLKNNTSSNKSYIQVTVPVYDNSGNKVGEALANVNDIKPNSTWKFKAIYVGTEKDVVIKTEELKVTGF